MEKRAAVAAFLLALLCVAAWSSEAWSAEPMSPGSWVRRFSGPANGVDQAKAMALDGEGNIYVTGVSMGNSGARHIVTIKYKPDGTRMWVKRYQGAGDGTALAKAIVVDGAGNVYVAGGCVGSGLSMDYVALKYDTNGVFQWARRYNGPANDYDMATAIALDPFGAVCLTGYSTSLGLEDYDYATVKYSAGGEKLWVRRYAGAAKGDDTARAIGVDGAGNVIVTGASYMGPGHQDDYLTIKYNASGTRLWMARYNGPENSSDGANAIAVDGSGNVHVTGSSGGDYATLKYNANGERLWLRRYDAALDWAIAIALDGLGNVCVTGTSGEPDFFFDYATLKYSPDGTTLWESRYNGPGNYTDTARAIAVDGSGNVYVTGESTGLNGSLEYATLKYGADTGAELWVKRYGGTTSADDGAAAVKVDGLGHVYVTGYSGVDYPNIDWATLKYF